MYSQHHRILIASDDPLGTQVLEYMHAHLGFSVDPVQSTEEALQRLQAERYGLLYVDLYQPPTAGRLLIHTVRNGGCGGHHQRMPIIIVAEYPGDLRCTEQLKADSTAVLGKPVYLDQLKQLLATFIGELPCRQKRSTVMRGTTGQADHMTAAL